MAYLKSLLPENTPTPVVLTARLGQEDGKFGVQFKYSVKWNGQQYDHSATMTEEKALQNFQPGQQAIVEKRKNSFGTLSLFWSQPQDGIPVASPQTAQVAQQQVMQRADTAQAEKDARICLQGFMQRIIPALIALGEDHLEGAIIERALRMSVAARDALLKKAKEIASPSKQKEPHPYDDVWDSSEVEAPTPNPEYQNY